ncbi:MAG: sigma-70 family RNA polymerase sigma factor [Bacteroidota bacterium]
MHFEKKYFFQAAHLKLISDMTQMEFNSRVSRLYQPLKNFALKLTRDSENAADLTQETITKAFYNRDKFREGTNMKAWLYTIMKNIFINQYRRQSSGLIVSDDTETQYYINSHPGRDHNKGERKMIMKEITRAISSLSKNLRVPFELAFKGYRYDEIANHMQVPLGTVKIRIHNARKKLRHILRDYDPATGPL